MRWRKHKKKAVSIMVALLLCVVVFLAWPSRASTPHQTLSNTPGSVISSPNGFNKKQYSLDEPGSIWVVVNKLRPLQPPSYVPGDLVVPSVPLRVPGNESMEMRQVTADAIEKMFQAASSDGVQLMVSSGYRSYNYQVGLYGGYAKQSGQAAADSFSARPGYSEHQTGLAVDVEPQSQECDVSDCFAGLPAGKWVAANSYKYGFILRYTSDKAAVTGFSYEPWHIRYVGMELAAQMHQQHIETLEEFFALPSAPNYAAKN